MAGKLKPNAKATGRMRSVQKEQYAANQRLRDALAVSSMQSGTDGSKGIKPASYGNLGKLSATQQAMNSAWARYKDPTKQVYLKSARAKSKAKYK